MRQIKKPKNQSHIIAKGQLTTLTLALASALAAMTPVTARADALVYGVTIQQDWTGGNFTLTNNGFISPSIPNAAGLSTGASVGTLVNNGTITATSGPAFLNAGYGVGAVLNNNGATISGYSAGVSNTGSIGAVINSGGTIIGDYTRSGSSGIDNGGTITSLINSDGATISGRIGISNSGLISTLNNSAAILGVTAISIDHGTIGELTNSGTINGYLDGVYYGSEGVRVEQGSIGTLINNNLITGYYMGIYIDHGTIDHLTNNSGGTIDGVVSTGITNDGGTIGTLTNNGLIRGSSIGFANFQGSNSALANNGTTGTLSNAGTIIGSAFGVYNDGTINWLGNSGSIIGSNGYGIGNFGTIQTLTNSGLISGGVVSGTSNGIGVYNQGGTIGTLINSGTISGDYDGILNTGSITVLSNTISGSIVSSSTGFAIQNIGTIDALRNSGLISAGTGIYNNGGTIKTLTNSGTISGLYSGVINFNGTIDALNNQGLISGVAGVFNYGGIIKTLTNSSTINSSYTISSSTANGISGIAYNGAVFNMGTITTLSNAGTINNSITMDNTGSGTIISGAIVNAGSITSLTNSGLINNNGSITVNNSSTGYYSSAAIVNSGIISTLTNASGATISSINDYGANGPGGFVIENQGSIGALNNAGLITGPTALYLNPGSSLGVLANTGTIAGDINSGTSPVLTITGGSGSSFGTLTGYGGTIGLITAYSSDLVFGSGNQLLNDNIALGSSGTVTNNGTLQVNNPLTITGNYYQGTGSSLIFGVTNPVFNGNATDTGYGRLVVSGDAVLASGSTVSLKALGYAFAQGQRYVVLAAGGTITNTGVTYSATGYSVTGSIQSDTSTTYAGYSDLVLTLGGTSGNNAVNNASSTNAASSLRGLFNYTGTDSSLLNVFNPAAALDTEGSANKAGEQLSPGSVRGAATQAAGASNQAVGNVANDRMDSVRVAQNGGSGIATGESVRDIALWGQVFGGRAAQGERDSVSGYHANFRGSLIGADGLVNDQLRIGALVSVSKTSVASDGDNTGSSASINDYGLKAYATYDGAPWYVNLQAGVARQKFSTVRNISYTGFSGTAYGDFNGTQYLSSVQAGYPLNLDAWLPGAVLTPIVGLSYSNLRQNGYTESGGNGAALTVNASSSSSFKSELGARLERSVDTSYGKLLPSVQVGWRHEYKDNATQTGASFAADSTGSTAFVGQSATPVANVGVLNLGVTLLRSANLTLSGKYTLEAGGGYTGQTASVQVRWRY